MMRDPNRSAQKDNAVLTVAIKNLECHNKNLIVMSTDRETSPEMEVASHFSGPQNFGRFLATPPHANMARPEWLRSK